MIYRDMTMEDYRNGSLKDYISQSKLKACGAEDSVGFVNSWVGSVVHKFMEVGMDRIDVVFAEFMTDSYRAQFADQKYKADRDMDLKFVDAKKMAESIHMDLHHVKELENVYHDTATLREASVTFTYDGLPMKCRPDMVSADMSIIVDWKTTSDIAEFERSIWKYMYDVQAFFYSTALAEHSMDPLTLPQFYFVCVDKNTFKTGVYKMSSDAYAVGEVRLKKLIRDYRIYLSGERRTATENGVFEIKPPRWMNA